MHIAHHRRGKTIAVTEVARRAGLKRRQIAYRAARGEVPDARRSRDGYHFEYRNTPRLRRWCDEQKRLAAERRLVFSAPKKWYSEKSDPDLLLPRKAARAFSAWRIWMEQNRPFRSWEESKLYALRHHLGTFTVAAEKVAKVLKSLSDQRLRDRVQNL